MPLPLAWLDYGSIAPSSPFRFPPFSSTWVDPYRLLSWQQKFQSFPGNWDVVWVVDSQVGQLQRIILPSLVTGHIFESTAQSCGWTNQQQYDPSYPQPFQCDCSLGILQPLITGFILPSAVVVDSQER